MGGVLLTFGFGFAAPGLTGDFDDFFSSFESDLDLAFFLGEAEAAAAAEDDFFPAGDFLIASLRGVSSSSESADAAAGFLGLAAAAVLEEAAADAVLDGVLPPPLNHINRTTQSVSVRHHMHCDTERVAATYDLAFHSASN